MPSKNSIVYAPVTVHAEQVIVSTRLEELSGKECMPPIRMLHAAMDKVVAELKRKEKADGRKYK